MKKVITLLFSLFSFSIMSAQQIIPNEIIVKIKLDVNIESFLKNAQRHSNVLGNIDVKKAVVPEWNIWLLKYDAKDVYPELGVELLKENEDVLVAETNFRVHERATTPNDPSFEQQWNLDKIEVEKVWDVTTGGITADGKEIVVMIVDSGFDVLHSELSNNVWHNPAEIPGDGIDNDENGYNDDVYGWNFIGNSPEFTFASNHGMAVAGIIGAEGNNNTGMSGINWNVKMMLFQCIEYNEIISSYAYAFEQRKLYNATNGEQGAFVVASNSSLGFSDPCSERPLWNDMLDSTGTVGILNAAATVNVNLDIDAVGDTPTSCASDYLVSVTNTDISDNKVFGAGYGATTIDLGAPGGSTSSAPTYSLAPNNGYNNNFGGCSSASPHVAGVIALMYGLPCADIGTMAMEAPAGTAALMKRSILEGAEPNSSLAGITVSGGRLNAYHSMIWWQIYCDSPTEDIIDVTTYVNERLKTKKIIGITYIDEEASINVDYSTTSDYEEFDVKIFDTLGRLVYQTNVSPEPFQEPSFKLNVDRLAAGAYFISVATGDKLEAKGFFVFN